MGAGWWGFRAADRAVGDVVSRFRPDLERSLSRPLGHRVSIGAYRGLRPLGIAIGTTRISPTKDDRSRVSLEGLDITLDPLASLRRLQPVLRLKIRGLQADLHRNANGTYWIPGRVDGSSPPPKFALHYRLEQPARISFIPDDRQLTLESNGLVQLAESSFSTVSRLRWVGDGGQVRLDGTGRWDRPAFKMRTRLESLKIQPLIALINSSNDADVSGELNADMRLRWTGDRLDCLGNLRLEGFQVQPAASERVLRSGQLNVGCRDGRLRLDPVQLRLDQITATAAGTVDLSKSFDLRIGVRRQSSDDSLDLRIDGPWAEPRWKLAGRFTAEGNAFSPGPINLRGDLRTPWTIADQRRVIVNDLQVQSPGLQLALTGELGRKLALRSTALSVGAPFWDSIPSLASGLGRAAPVSGVLDLSGSLESPLFKLDLSQASNPIIDRWSLKARWSERDAAINLDRFDSPVIKAEARLPLTLEKGTFQTGELRSGVVVESLDLSRFSALAGVELGGRFSLRGHVDGPLEGLRPDLQLSLDQPRVASLNLPERWDGVLAGQLGQGARLNMSATRALVPGSLSAVLTADGWPSRVSLERGNGALRMDGTPGRYRWTADSLDLDGLELAVPPGRRFESLAGRLSGQGELAVNPLNVSGTLDVTDPGLRGIALKKARLNGRLQAGRFQVEAELTPAEGTVLLNADGQLGGGLASRLDASGLDVNWLLNLARQLREGDPLKGEDPGRAEDLGTLVINTFGGSLDGQLRALDASRRALEVYALAHPSKGPALDRLEGRLDAVIRLQGPSIAALTADLESKAHLWLEGEDRVRALQLEPVVATVTGPVTGGAGNFSLVNLPFSLLALIAPVPSALRGAIGATGRYNFSGDAPLIESELALQNAFLADEELSFDRGSVVVEPNALRLDLGLRAGASNELITMKGLAPLNQSDQLDLVIESHGDALESLAALGGDALKVKGGTTDLRLIIRGQLDQPLANGFLVVKDGDLMLGEQPLRQINASLLFDFDRLEIQSLKAKLGSGGSLLGSGSIGLFSPQAEDLAPLKLNLSKGKIRQTIVQFEADGELVVNGALVKPVISGDLKVSRGSIKPRTGLLGQIRKRGMASTLSSGVQKAQPSAQPVQPVSVDALLEEKWDFNEPLVLMGPGAPLQGSDQLGRLLPNLPEVSFRDFRLELGPDLKVLMPPFISFSGGGQLLLNGPLDPSLQARGLIRLNSGRISLFTTSFTLDPKAPNVAVFTPSLGLVPFVDIAMRSRVSDSVSIGTGDNATTANVFDTNGMGTASLGGGQLRLVKVTVEVTGPANQLVSDLRERRLGTGLQLRSSPPLSESQLLSLIGGNSLAGLADGGGSAALATVVGQSLLSPVLGTLTDAMGQRMQIALFPTYVTPEVKSEKERTSGQVPPTFTLVTEIGVDVTDNFDFSVLAAPNNSDVPEQGSVTYQLTPNTSISGSIDTNGTWQSQLQVFFRF